MLWRELIDLEPDLIEVEAWVRTLEPDAPQVMNQIEERLRPLVGWDKAIPGYEEVPYSGIWPSFRDKDKHDRLTGNNRRKWHFYNKLPLPARMLYTSEAWDCAVHHMVIVLRARRRELEELSRTGEGEPTRSNHMDFFGTEPDDSSGYVTVSALRRALRGKPGNAFIYISVDGTNRCPVVEVKFEESEAADEGGTGEVVLLGE